MRDSLPTLGRLLLGHLARFRDARLQDAATRVLRETSGSQHWVITVVNGTIRARQVFTYCLVLLPRTLLSRLRFVFGGAAVHDDRPPRRLSLLCPTRGRVEGVVTLLRSLQRTAAAPNRIDVLFYVDSDDPQLASYEALFASAARRFGRLGRCTLLVGEPVGVPAAWNALAAAAEGELLLMANDDQVYVDYGWDVRLDNAISVVTAEHPDGVFCLYFDDGQYGGGADFPIVSRPWYKALGYFSPTMFQQWEVERWMFDLARRVGRLFPVAGVFVEHRHYQDYKAPFDATYQRHRLTRRKSMADHALFLRTATERERDAALLRRAMNGDTVSPNTETRGRDPHAYWFAGYLEQHHPMIKAEIRAAPPQEPVALFAHGQRQAGPCATYPVTAAVVSGIPEATTFGPGEVRISGVGRGEPTVVDEAARDVLHVQLGVLLPDDAAVQVDGEVRAWPEGACLVFDGRSRGPVVVSPRPASDEPRWIVLSLVVALHS